MPSSVFRPDLLADQVAVVTGGGSGLGRAITLELASLGCTVVVAGRRERPLAETVELARAAQAAEPSGSPADRVFAMACDIREEDQVDALVSGVLERHGRIDLLVNNAGGQFLSAAEDITPKGFRTVIRLNVEGTWLMTHAVATRAMIPAGGGTIISVTLSPHNGMPGMAHSSAARAAVENLMRVLAVEWARFNIRCNAIAPGQFATETLLTKYPQPIVDSLTSSIPLGRLGQPEEIAWLVALLASPAGAFWSGSVVTVDGARDNWLGTWPPAAAATDDGRPLAEARRPRTP